jgi:hypothetical protein
MSKIIYVVTGSQDGVIGVYGNVKAAYDKACEYITNAANSPKVTTSYNETLKGCKGWGKTIESSNSDYSAKIEVFFLNQ